MTSSGRAPYSFLILFPFLAVSACSSGTPSPEQRDDAGVGAVGAVSQEITAQPDPTCAYARYGVHDYWVCSATKTFSAAKTTCESVGMHLARVDNSSENDFVKGQLGADSWIGATDSVAEGTWRWINDNAQFWSGKRPGNPVGGLYNKWTSVEPNDLFGEDCGLMVKSSGEWNDIACSLSRAFVCESSPSTDGQPQAPDTACTRTTRNGSTYWTCSNARSWDTARANCQSVGLDLVAIDDAAEASFLAPSFTRETHVGLTDRAQEGTWRWTATDRPSFCGTSSGRTPYGSYSNWTSGQPIRANDCQKVESDTRSYWICKNGMTWDAAKDECAGSGMTLARIDNAAENDLIASKAIVDTWIGGTDRAAEGQWRWTDNVQFWTGGASGGSVAGRYTNFQVTEPNDLFGENCLLMYVGGKWNDSLCDAPLGGIGFACEGPKNAGPPDRNDCAFAASGGKWSAGACSTGRAYVCESVPAGAKPVLEDVTAQIRENHRLGAPRVMGFDMKAGTQVKEPFVGLEERLGLRACEDALEPTGTPKIVRSSGLERVIYAQTYQGVPVLNRGYAVLRNPNTKVVASVMGDVHPNINVSTTPVLTQAQALSRAVAAVGHQVSDYNPAPVGKLRILPKKQGPDPQWELGWVFSLPRSTRDSGYKVGVSAITGNTLLRNENLRSCVMSPPPSNGSQGRATVNVFQSTFYLDPNQPLVTTGGSNATYPTFLRSTGTTLDPQETPTLGIRPLFGRPQMTSTCGTEGLLGYAVRPNWSNVMQTTPSPIQFMPNGVTPPTDEQVGAVMFLAAQTSLDAFASVFEYKETFIPGTGNPTTTVRPWIGFDGLGTRPMNLHFGVGGSSYLEPNYNSDGTIKDAEFIHMDTIATPPDRDLGATLDHFSHELGHGIWRYHDPEDDPMALEIRGIAEGYSDILASTVEAAVRLPKTSHTGQFCLGGDPWSDQRCDRDHEHPIASSQSECTLADGTRIGCCFHDASGNPIRGGCPSDYNSAEYCKAGVTCDQNQVQGDTCCDEHTNATVFDHWHYLVTKGDSQVNSNTCAYKVNPLSTDLLQSSKNAGRIVFNAIRDQKLKDFTFPGLAEATVQSAIDLFGAESEQVKSVRTAWYAVNVAENPFDLKAKLNPKRGEKKVHPWVTFAWPAGENETEWDLQVDDNNFAGPSPDFEEKKITTSAGTGAARLGYFSVAFPENSNTHYVWRVRPHSVTNEKWADCYAVHWFDGTGPLTEPAITLGNYTNGLLNPGASFVMFPQTPGVLEEALHEYRVQFSQNNVSCRGNDPCVGPTCVPEHVFTLDGPLHVVPFSGTQPGGTYYAHVQAVGPIDFVTKERALGPCTTATANSGPPQAPTYLVPANGERFNLYSPHERDPETPSSLANLTELRWSVSSWMRSSRVEFRRRTETGCGAVIEDVKTVDTPASCVGNCSVSLKVPFTAPYPGGYCWEVFGVGDNGVTSPSAKGSWGYFVNVATNRQPGVAATSGSPGSLGGETAGSSVPLKWDTVPSATGYEVKVWQWTYGYGTEQPGNPLVYPNSSSPPSLPASATEVKLNLTGRYCWELIPLIEDPSTMGQSAAIQPKVNAGGPICFTTGPAAPKVTFDNRPPARGYDGKDVTGQIEFGYIPDEKYWTNAGDGWDWEPTSQPWCTTFNQVYRDIVKCIRKFRIPAAEGKKARFRVKTYEGAGAPGTRAGGTVIHNIDELVEFKSCGQSTEPCCTNKSCDLSSLVCNNSTDTCVTCGGLNQPCCKVNGANKCTTAGLICRNDAQVPAGEKCLPPTKPDLQISMNESETCGRAMVDVRNVGDAPSGPFNVAFDGIDCCFQGSARPLPQACPSLQPGAVCTVLGIYNCQMANFVITADPDNLVAERNENDNQLVYRRCAPPDYLCSP